MENKNITKTRDFIEFETLHKGENGDITSWKYEDTGIDCLKIIPIDNYSKAPTRKGWNTTDYTYEELCSNNGNFGYAIGYNHKENGLSLACVDIDGLYDKNGKKIPEITEYLYDILKELRESQSFEIHKSPNGYHIFCWNRTQPEYHNAVHYVSNNLTFPKEMPEGLEDFAGKPLGNALEIFTKEGRQVVAAGSIVDGKKYERISFGDNILGATPPLSSNTMKAFAYPVDDINEIVKKIFIDAGFGWTGNDLKENKLTTFKTDFIPTTERKKKTDKQKQEIANIIIETLQIVKDGGKDKLIISWGGFFGRNLTWDDSADILERVIEHPKRPEFKSVSDCRNHFQINFEKGNNPKNTNITGFPEIKKDLKDFGKSDNWIEGFDFQVRRLVFPNFKFQIKGNKTNNFGQDYYVLDYGNEIIYKKSIKRKTAKEISAERKFLIEIGKSIDNISEYKETRRIELFYGTIDSISILRSVIGENDSSLFEVIFTPNNEIPKKIKNTDFEKITKAIAKNDAGGQEFKNCLMKIKSYFKKTGVTKTKCDVPCAGLFLNPVTGELVRSRGEGVIDINYEKPSRYEVKEALELLKKFYDFYNGIKENFIGVFRWFILAPFSYIMKTEYMNPVKSLFLYGEPDTAKTSLARVGMLMWSKIDSSNNTGGDNISTPYRFGNVMGKNGYGVIVDECESLCRDTNEKLMPIFKKAWEEELARETNDGKYYAYGNLLFTSNKTYPEEAAFFKRCDLYHFPSEYKQSDEDKKKFGEEFHFYNKNNNDFAQKFPAIGDFLTFFVWKNTSFLDDNKDKTHDEIRNKLIDALVEYGEVNSEDYKWLKTTVKSEKSIRDGELSLLESLRSMILEETKRMNYQNIDNKIESYFFNKDDNKENELKYFFNPSKVEQVEYLMHIEAYDYLHYDREKGCVGISKEVSQALSRYTNGKYDDVPKIIAGKFGGKFNGKDRWHKSRLNGSQRHYIHFTKDEFDKFLKGEWE